VDSPGAAVRGSGPGVTTEFQSAQALAVRRDERSVSVVGRNARLDPTLLYRHGRTVLAEAYADAPFRIGR
jgi:hypothetical protein